MERFGSDLHYVHILLQRHKDDIESASDWRFVHPQRGFVHCFVQ